MTIPTARPQPRPIQTAAPLGHRPAPPSPPVADAALSPFTDRTVQTASVSAATKGQRTRTRTLRTVSDDDHTLLRALARYRALTYQQAATHLGCSLSACGRRIRRLIALGVVEAAPFTVNKYRWIGLTKAGYLLVGDSHRPTPWSLTTLPHTWLVAERGIALEANGVLICSDRELQGLRTRDTTKHQGAAISVKLATRQHIPDLLAPIRDGELAIECQISRKPASYFQEILRGYYRDEFITAVHYVVTSTELKHRIAAAVAATKTETLVTIVVADLAGSPFHDLLNQQTAIAVLQARRAERRDQRAARFQATMQGTPLSRES